MIEVVDVAAMTLEEAVAVVDTVDWECVDALTTLEKAAIVNVTSRYMIREISRERCAEILRLFPEELPAQWSLDEECPSLKDTVAFLAQETGE